MSDPIASPFESTIQIVVVGAHLTGQPLNHQLTDRGGELVRAARTADCYRFYALPTDPPKPGLVRVVEDDPARGSIEVEVWTLPVAAFGSFVDDIPAPLAIGRVRLDDGSAPAGFLCEAIATVGAPDITAFGGWRAYLDS